MIIAVDAGKHTTKAISAERKTFSMRTKLDVDGLMLGNGKTYEIEYENKRYIVGDGANSIDYDVTKTQLRHKICTAVAISKLTQQRMIDLVIGCPITQYINKEERKKHADYFRGNVRIKINKQPFEFSIESVTVLPESFGFIVENAKEFLNGLCAVIDIGGLNTNAAIFRNLKPVPSSVFCVNEGGNMTNAKIKRALNTTFLANYQDYEIPYVKENSKTKPIIDEVLDAQMQRILSECKKYNWNIAELPIVFTGGGSLMLERQIKAISGRISKNPIWDNVQGFLRFKEVF